MLRKRIFSFAFGFSATGAAIAHFVWKDLWSSHAAVSLQTRDYYDALERRIERLESEALPRNEEFQHAVEAEQSN